MTTIYSAICFAPDGEYVRDFYSNSKEYVSNEIANMGSRWFFYPFIFIATKTTIVDAPECLGFLNGKRIKTVERFFKERQDHDVVLPDRSRVYFNDGGYGIDLLNRVNVLSK